MFAVIFTHVEFFFLGLFVWELLMTIHIEYSMLTGKRKFRWPMTFYFLCRYSLLFSQIGIIVSLSVTHKINCNALYKWNQIGGNLCIATASTLLILRTIAIWQRKLPIVIMLVGLSVAHWAVLIRGMFVVTAEWDPVRATCVIVSADQKFIQVCFFYTMAFDAVILVTTFIALFRQINVGRRSDLWNLLLRDGFFYFLVSFSCNSVPAILNVLSLNAIMDIISAPPAVVLSSIAACRIAVRLQNFSHGSTPQATVPQATSKIQFSRPANRKYGQGIHVTTDQFTMEDLATDIPNREAETKQEQVYRSNLGQDLGDHDHVVVA